MPNSHFRIIDLILAACLIIPPASASDLGGGQRYALRTQVRNGDLQTHRPVFNSEALNLEAVFGNAKILPGSSGPHVKHQTHLGYVAAPVEEDPLWDLFTMGALIRETIWTTLIATHQEFLNALCHNIPTEASLAKALEIEQNEVLPIARDILRQIKDYQASRSRQVRKPRPFEKQLMALGRPFWALLTDRQKEAVQWRLQGLANKEVADLMKKSEQTIKNYIRNVTNNRPKEIRTDIPLDRQLEEDPLWDLFIRGALIRDTIWTTLPALHRKYLYALCHTTLTETSLAKALEIEETEVLPTARDILRHFRDYQTSASGQVRKPWPFEKQLMALGRPFWNVLTDREKEAIQWRLQGLENKEVAGQMNIRIQTVKNHIGNVRKKKTDPESNAAIEAPQHPVLYSDHQNTEDPLWDLFTRGALIHETIWTTLIATHQKFLNALCPATLTEASLAKALEIEQNEVLPIARDILRQFKDYQASPSGQVRKPWPFEKQLMALGRPFWEALTDRVQEAAQWRLRGLENKEVADQMGISKQMVKNYIQKVTNIHRMGKQMVIPLEGLEASQSAVSYSDRQLDEDPLWDLFIRGALIRDTIWTTLPALDRKFLYALCHTTLTEASLAKTLGIEQTEVLPTARKILRQFKDDQASPRRQVRKPTPFEKQLMALGRPFWNVLTDREKEVVQWRLQGLENKEVAKQLEIRERTVKKYLQDVTNIHLIEKQMGSPLEGLESLTSTEAPEGPYSDRQRRSS